MLRTRIIPCLLLKEEALVKTVKFTDPAYIGDPINTVRIFNELEVDELCFLDIRASVESRQPNYELLAQIANECFMPLSYGGGIDTFAAAQKIFSIGFEKVVINTHAYRKPHLIKELSTHFGSQAIIGSIDIRRNFFGKPVVYINDGTEKIATDPVAWAQRLVELGVGELLITAIDREGTWKGYDIEIVKKIADAVSLPVIANGGAGSVADIAAVVQKAGASAAALGSMVVFQKKDMGVLINFPDKQVLEHVLV